MMTGALASCPGTAVVLDTNAALDWLVFGDPRIGNLGSAITDGRVAWLATAGMRVEFACVLQRAGLAPSARIRQQALTVFDRMARLRSDPLANGAGLRCTDADDQVFLDLALAEGARWLVTRDKALLALRRRATLRGLTISPPQEWAEGRAG